MSIDRWARAAVRRKPQAHDYTGCSYEMASRRALAICKAAAESGQTINASLHLSECAQLMQILAPAREG